MFGEGLLASRPRLSNVVPQGDDRLIKPVVLKREHADARRTAEKMPPSGRRQSQPPGRDHSDDVGTGEGEGIASDAAYPLNEAVGPNGKAPPNSPVPSQWRGT